MAEVTCFSVYQLKQMESIVITDVNFSAADELADICLRNGITLRAQNDLMEFIERNFGKFQKKSPNGSLHRGISFKTRQNGVSNIDCVLSCLPVRGAKRLASGIIWDPFSCTPNMRFVKSITFPPLTHTQPVVFLHSRNLLSWTHLLRISHVSLPDRDPFVTPTKRYRFKRNDYVWTAVITNLQNYIVAHDSAFPCSDRVFLHHELLCLAYNVKERLWYADIDSNESLTAASALAKIITLLLEKQALDSLHQESDTLEHLGQVIVKIARNLYLLWAQNYMMCVSLRHDTSLRSGTICLFGM